MTLSEAKALINCDPLKTPHPQTWFDLGCGSGLFSKALKGLLVEGSLIYAVDKEPARLVAGIEFLRMDFVKDPLPQLSTDGILMANSLHYVRDKLLFLSRIKGHLKSNGVFLLVEYDTETSNRWVPYPLNFSTAIELFKRVGFDAVDKISERPSLFNSNGIYSAVFYNQNFN